MTNQVGRLVALFIQKILSGLCICGILLLILPMVDFLIQVLCLFIVLIHVHSLGLAPL